MERVIKLTETEFHTYIKKRLLEYYDRIQYKENSLPEAIGDFARIYKAEGPDGPNVMDAYHGFVAAFMNSGCEAIREALPYICKRMNIRNGQFDDDVDEIYLSFFYDNEKRSKRIMFIVFNRFGPKGAVGPVVNSMRFNLIRYARDYALKTIPKTPKRPIDQNTVIGIYNDINSEEDINRSMENKMNILKMAVDASNKGNFSFGNKIFHYYAQALIDILPTSQSTNTVELYASILARLRELSGKTITENYFQQIKKRFIDNVMPKVMAEFGNDSYSRHIAECVHRALKNLAAEAARQQ